MPGFAVDGPDALNSGSALRVLHHKLFEIDTLGLDAGLRVQMSSALNVCTDAGRAIYGLHQRAL